MVQRTLLKLTLGTVALLLAVGCSSKPIDQNVLAVAYEETQGEPRLLRATFTALNAGDQFEVDTFLPSDAPKSAVGTCAITKATPACTLVLPIDALIALEKRADGAVQFTVFASKAGLIPRKYRQQVLYERGNVAFSDSGKLSCVGTLSCGARFDGLHVVFWAKSTTESVTVGNGTSSVTAPKGAEATVALELGEVGAGATASYFDGTSFTGAPRHPVTLKVGTGAVVSSAVEIWCRDFEKSLRATLEQRAPLPAYASPPAPGRNRRALLVLGDPVKLVGPANATFDTVDTFALVKPGVPRSISCGTYRSSKSAEKVEVAGSSIPSEVTVFERLSGRVLGTRTLQPSYSPCRDKLETRVPDAVVTTDEIVNLANSFSGL